MSALLIDLLGIAILIVGVAALIATAALWLLLITGRIFVGKRR